MSSSRHSGDKAPNISLPIHVRAYTIPMAEMAGAKSGKARPERQTAPGPSDVSLIFDCETTTDARQRLRFLVFQLRIGAALVEEGIAYDALDPGEIDLLQTYCAEAGLAAPMTLDSFRSEVLLKRGYEVGAAIIGFNLPFDLSRIALDSGPARASKFRRKFKGGFSLALSDKNWRPHLQIKHLNARSALFEFTVPGEPQTSRSRRKRRQKTAPHRGYFCDVKTLAGALLSRSFSLAALARELRTPTQKLAVESHGGPLTTEYIHYGRADVQVTWECFIALRTRYEGYGLSKPIWEILSEASIGKAALAEMGIRPWREVQPNADPKLIGRVIATYFGGRTEVRWRKTAKRVRHTDFMSMYPTICALMDLWQFVIAEGFEASDATEEIRGLVADFEPAQLFDPGIWPKLAGIVRVRPARDLLPVRAPYAASDTATIGLNHLTVEADQWFTLADVLVALLLGDKPPEILEAIRFTPGSRQEGLRPVSLMGRHTVDPYQQDFFRALIQLRIAEGVRADQAVSQAEKASIEDGRLVLKLIANSSSYGIYMQLNTEAASQTATVDVFGPDGAPFSTHPTRLETPGPYFNPLLATLITGGARLMLGLAEFRTLEEGLDWVFTDTDSLAIAKPEHMSEAEFRDRTDRVVNSFGSLNPYGGESSILQVEKINEPLPDAPAGDPLYCLAISSKRYALYNLDAEGRPVIRKASAHGLGHLLPPYGDDDPAPGVPPPDPSLKVGRDKLHRWEYDLWYKIVEAHLQGRLDAFKSDYHPALARPSVSRYAATSPELHRWFKPWNFAKPYADQLKPFGFIYALHARARRTRYDDVRALTGASDGPPPKPVAPFDRDLVLAVAGAFDRITGRPISPADLQTYSEALNGYQNREEAKFANAGPLQSGRTERRHVFADHVALIGKEADELEETYFVGLRSDTTVRYGGSPAEERRLYSELRTAAGAHGVSATARATNLSRAAVHGLLHGRDIHTKMPHQSIREGLRRLSQAKVLADAESAELRRHYEFAIREYGGLRPAARALGIDASNLQKSIKRLSTNQKSSSPGSVSTIF